MNQGSFIQKEIVRFTNNNNSTPAKDIKSISIRFMGMNTK